MAITKFFPGFRFHPTDVELVKYYLKRKVMGKKSPFHVIAEVDIYKFSPWDLPDKSLLTTGDLEWYFFCPRGRKYASGARLNRATETGYWKTTGKDRSIQHNNLVVGMIKTLIFHTGKAPNGERTDWVMHEFRLQDKALTDQGIPQDSYVICKVFQKQGIGPRNGAQYGKPFNEEDWDEEDAPSAPIPVQPADDMNLSSTGVNGLTSVSCLSGLIPSPCLTNPSAPSNQSNDVSQLPDDGGILSVLDFVEDNTLVQNENKTEEVDNRGQERSAEGVLCSNSSDIFEDLPDLDMPMDYDYLELLDLEWPAEVDNLGQERNAEGVPCSNSSDIFEELPDLDIPMDHDYLELRDLEWRGK